MKTHKCMPIFNVDWVGNIDDKKSTSSYVFL